jgi:hypothetical protein
MFHYHRTKDVQQKHDRMRREKYLPIIVYSHSHVSKVRNVDSARRENTAICFISTIILTIEH